MVASALQSRKGFQAASEARFISPIHVLEHPEGQRRAELPSTPLGKLLASKNCQCSHLIHSLNPGGEYSGLMLLPQSSSYLTSSKVTKRIFLVIN